ncbi:hypothetical protein NQ315_017007 [Exocentrus adspersus]|uniref:Cytochrome P450 n=1 Tax=Exocentrus adspersus TaxID=1586481 RepID=A0AAV8VAR4_9CUCU|nr:hypothetical protein NQ315_017007 [Exocentrus adspersus]
MLTDNPIFDLFIITTAVIAAIVAYFHHSYKYWERRGFPFLTPKFPLGNSVRFVTKSPGFGIETKIFYKDLKRKGHKFGGIYTITNPVLVVVDPDYIRDILTKDFHYFVNRGQYHNEKTDPISAHLFALDETKWKNMRTKLTPTFTSGKMKMMFQSILDLSRNMIEAIDESVAEQKDIDIKQVLACFTTDVIGSCAFGIECNSFKGTEAEFRRMGQKIFEADSLPRMLKLLLAVNLPQLALKLGISTHEKEVSQFFYQVVEKTIRYREDNNYTRPDFLQLLINIRNDSKASEHPFTMDQLVSNMRQPLPGYENVAQVFLFFIAGFDTSSSAMNFAIYELCKNPSIQEKVREEIREVLQKHGGQLTYEGLAEMKYMQQVLDETLRIYPSVTTLTRVCVKDYKLRDTDLTIEKGIKVMIPLYSLHNDPEYFPEPDRFDPDRFSDENKRSMHPYTHLPFGDGPRNCIGLRFGIMQSKVGLAAILSRFRLKISPSTRLPLRLDEGVLLIKTLDTLYINAEKI